MAFPVLTLLTDRERQVLGLVASRARNAQIAETLGISDQTVRNHISSIRRRLQARSRAELIDRGTELTWTSGT